MFLYPSIIMEVGQDKGPWKTIFWLEPDLNSIHVCWIQGVCPPQEIQCHITTQSWRMPTQQHTTSLTASQVFDVWPSEKSEAPASYYYLSKTWIQEPSRWGLRELSACCAPTASGAHFEGCNVSFRSYSRVWISMEPLSWKDQPGRCCY